MQSCIGLGVLLTNHLSIYLDNLYQDNFQYKLIKLKPPLIR